MEKKIMNDLKKFVYTYDINQAYTYKDKIVYVGNSNFSNSLRHQFIFTKEKVFVSIVVENQNIKSVDCSCIDFQKHNSCFHIAAAVINYANYLLPESSDDYIILKSREILKSFSQTNHSGITKKKLNVEYLLVLRNTYWGLDYTIKLKIGTDKLYSIGSKYNKFIAAYHDENGRVQFGKNFTYDPSDYYFAEDDSRILNFLYTNAEYHNSSIYIESNDFIKLMHLLSNKVFLIENLGKFSGILNSSPILINLSKEADKYYLNIDFDKNFIPLTNNLEYIFYENKIYHLEPKIRKFIKLMQEEQLDTLVFKDEDFDSFSKGILPIVKNELTLSQELEDLKIISKPEVELYFDINQDYVVCNPVFIYGNDKVGYFDKSTKVFKDTEYENQVINELLKYKFKIIKRKIILNEINDIVDFLEKEITQLASLYKVFTSEKIKNTDIRKKLRISSTFSIGKDNILNYNFNLDGIDYKELSNVFSSLKEKKKYHKLKNGDILSLEDESLNQLANLVDDLDISFEKESGSIPKYKALYLESLKSEKYNIIKTDDMFTNFIEKFQKYKDAKITFNEQEKKLLRNYQQEGVQWLYNIHKCDLGGILADEMGLGKSIQTIYFFKHLLNEDPQAKFIIVCPTALVYNWLNEFKKFAPDIQVGIFVGEKQKRKNLIEHEKVSVYITSYGTLREDSENYQDKNFKICVIDEAQNIKNPLAKNTKVVKKINAKTKIALTGTPIENSVEELWSIFDFIMPGFLSTLTKFNRKYKFKQIDEKSSVMLSNLNRIISPFILRRKKKDVLKELPKKIENNIFIDLDKEQKRLYAAEIKRVEEQMDQLIMSEGFSKSKLMILQLLTKLRQLCIDPKLVFENYKGKSSKVENLIKIIKELIDNNHKILIFTSFKSALDIVSKQLDNNNITYYQIDGTISSKRRQELVDKFNTDLTQVFLITLKSGGTGLNLTSADVVIHLDLWWNPQAENQATDRAHRIGQKNNVEVIKLISTGTIEEKILDLQKKKKTLSDTLIEKNENSEILAHLTEKDIRNLLKFENSSV